MQLFFNGVAAPLIYASATQINTIVPYEVASSSNVAVTVKYQGQTSAPYTVNTVAAQPSGLRPSERCPCHVNLGFAGLTADPLRRLKADSR